VWWVAPRCARESVSPRAATGSVNYRPQVDQPKTRVTRVLPLHRKGVVSLGRLFDYFA
jgi:hypothetical protein